ncbi:serine/threonine-protein kinase HipA [Trinickia symbiotica]|uniref:Type II toxin-antitoxin system HipA family toxin n=1 Tax=Trinickia symbiotica TaxID=863227 RepID=A0A2N7X7J0_9BURK|nr:type II toxin-antitoxin system HipA family toxin [Trinickia symbiotica]PMS37425.1 type II toxin-antitoxin system HipA family toxin [Trinickia symbiotica]PPK42756.1 serine/threonine-protein kinase HipA [Trinickia symbiotica]
MAEKERPVWVWLPGQTEPVRCGTFWWSPGLGRFRYGEEYRKVAGAVPIDPINLPFTRSSKPYSTDQWNGLFGVLRDAAPEGFGLDLLLSKYSRESLDEIDRLELSAGDGVGAIEVCSEEQLEHKLAFAPPPEENLLAELGKADLPGSLRPIVQRLSGADDGTSLGGEKPKLTVSRAVGNAHEWWIAKLPERGGSPFLPTREYVAMTLARKCDIDAATVNYRRIGPHGIVLIRRFDRKVSPAGVERSLFASAATVLRLRSVTTREDDARSYVAFSDEIRRWCAVEGERYAAEQRELWRRMAFNALVGNIDDHPRNHGLLFRDGHWGLSPAYDIVAMPNSRGGQGMAINRKRLETGRVGQRIATPESLVYSADLFSYTKQEAWETLRMMASTVHESWRSLYVDGCDMAEADLESQRSAFQLAEDIVTGKASLNLADVTPQRRQRMR